MHIIYVFLPFKNSFKHSAEVFPSWFSGGFDDIKGAIKTFLSLGSAVNGLRSVFNETFESVKTLDKSFAQIAMVTDYSVQEMWSSYDQYADMA